VGIQPIAAADTMAEPALDQRDATPRRFTLLVGNPEGWAVRQTVTALDALISELQQLRDRFIVSESALDRLFVFCLSTHLRGLLDDLPDTSSSGTKRAS
jgi:predicted RNA-binding protein with EMAP domain